MLNNQTLQKAKQILKERKNKAEFDAFLSLQNALKHDEFKDIFFKIKNAEKENAKCEVYNLTPTYDINALLDKQNKILSKLKLNIKDFEPNYTCKKCHDTGYVNDNMCDCLKEIINKLLLKQSGLVGTLKDFNSCDISKFDDKEKISKIYSTMQKWCTKKSDYLNIILTGKTGVGKTHLMECMANELIKNNKIIYFVSAFSLNQALLKYHTTFDNSKIEYLSPILDCDYLFIDDLGTEPILKNVTVEGLYNVLSERISNKKPTIISTNLTLDQIEEVYGERIFSRLVNRNISLCIKIENKDLRLKK